MSSSYNFKDNLTIDNNKYLKWLDITGTSRANIISLDNLNNVKINSAFGDLVLNSESNNSYTFLNVNGNSSGVLIGSKIGVGFNTTTNMNSLLTLNKNNFIGINTTTGSNDGYLGLAGSSSLDTTGSRIILYGNESSSSNNGKLNLYAGNTGNGTINLFTGDDKMRFQILNDGTLNVLPDGVTSRLIINNTNSTFTNDVILSSGTESTNATTGALRVSGGIGITGSVYIQGSLSLTTTSIGNLNFSSSNPSTSYSSGAVVLHGGMGISNTTNSSSITAGGGLSIAGGAAIGKDLYVGGKIKILDSTSAISSEDASVVLYGGLGINSNILLRSNLSSQIKLSPITEQNETSISFYSKNNFTSSSNTGSSWTLGHNVNSVSSGNFALANSQFGNILSATYSGKISMLGNVYIDSQTLKIPRGTTAERPTPAEQGFIRYNSELEQFEGFGAGNSWGSLGGGGGTTSGNIIANSINLGVSNMFSGSFIPSNNVSVASNVTGLYFNNSDIRSFIINLTVSITRTIGGSLYEYFTLEGNQKDSGWELLISSIGDISGFTFTITSLGQIQYTSTNITNFSNSIIRYNVNEITNTGTYDRSGLETQGTLITNTMQILNTQDVNIGINNGALYVAGGVTINKTLLTSRLKLLSTEIALGHSAGTISQGVYSVAIGSNSGVTSQGNSAVAIGEYAGYDSQGFQTVAIGFNSGAISQGNMAVAIGNIAAIYNQGGSSVAVGDGAGTYYQGSSSVAMGVYAGNTSQGNYAIAIGSGAGLTSQHNNSIVLNASGTELNSTTVGAFYVSSIRNVTQANLLAYDISTKEVSYFSLSNITTTNLVSTNISSANISSANIFSTNISSTTLTSTNLTSTNIVATNLSAGTLAFSNINVSTVTIGSNLLAIGNSNTLGSIITTGGNVGIGTTAPTTTLDLVSSTGLPSIRLAGGGGAGNSVGITLTPFRLRIGGAASRVAAIDDGNSSAHLVFDTAPTGSATTILERMRITNSGNVGIGTTNPGSLLHIQGSAGSIPVSPSGNGIHMGVDLNSNSSIQLNSGSVGSTNFEYIDFGFNGSEYVTRMINSNQFRSFEFYVNGGTFAMQLLSTGNVGIPTLFSTNITSTNVVASNITLGNTGNIRFNNDGSGMIWGNNFSRIYDDAQLRIFTDDQMFFHIGNTIGTAMYIASNSNVGIGTTSPGSALHVVGTIGSSPTGNGVHMGNDSVNNASIIQINQGSVNTGLGIIDFGYSGNNYVSRIVHDNTDKSLEFLVNSGTLSMTLASTGNVGIGTVSPTSKIHIDNNNNSSGIEIGVGTGNTTSNLTLYGSFSDGYAIIQAGSTNNTANANLKITRRGTTNGTIANFHVYSQTSAFLGNLGIGTISPSSRLHVTGNVRADSIQMNAGGGTKQIANGTQAGGSASGTVSFPFTFTNTPVVVANIDQNINDTVFNVQITSITTTGFTYRKTFYRFSGTPFGGDAVGEGFYWIAMG